MKKKGFRVGVEGCEGGGKTTLLNLLQKRLDDVVLVQEPGTTVEALKFREQIMENPDIDEFEKATLFAKARKSVNHEIIIPAINSGKIVLSDRTIYSSIVYQELEPDLFCNFDTIVQVNEKIDDEFTMPDVLILIDIDPEISLERIKKNNRETNYFDELPLEHHQKIRNKYLDVFNSTIKPKLLLTNIDDFNTIIDDVVDFINSINK